MKDIAKMIINEEKKGHVKQELDQKQETRPSQVVEKMPLIVDKDNKPRKVRANLTKLLTYYDDNLIDLFVFNEATHHIEIVEDRKIGLHKLKKGVFNGTALVQLASYISSAYLLDFQNSVIADEVEAIAVTKTYNPIKNFLKRSLINKATRDPFTIIRQYLNIKDTEYNRIALDLFFRGAVARVLDPGCQFDYCLDLVGPQGGRKTTFLRQLFMEWYTDQITSFELKDDKALMVGAWLVNDEELEATKKISFGGLKKVVTLSVVTYRPPYGRTAITLPVDFVFSRTTNEPDHLGDATGDRRFLAVEVDKTTAKHKKVLTDEDLRDIWGNYYASYLDNQKLYYDDSEPEHLLIEQEREKFKKIDEVAELLNWYINQPIPDDFFNQSTADYQRRSFYSQLQSTGVAYRSQYEERNRVEWAGTVERDRVAVKDIINDIFYEQRNDKKLRRRIILYFENLPDWEKKKSIKFGRRQSSGYIKKV